MIYHFDTFRLNTDTAELSRDGAPVLVEPLPLRLLQYLIENRARTVSKDTLLAEVWHGRSVSDWAISAAVKSARLALNDTGTPRSYIRTLHAKGFRFVAVVTMQKAAPVNSAQAAPGLRLIVLPFDTLSPTDDHGYFAEGLTEDLITDLSQTPGLNVASRNASVAMKSKSATPAEIARTLDISHILEGSVRRDGDRVRINAQLVEIASGDPLWTDRFTCIGDGLFDLQDQLCAQIVSALKLHLTAPTGKRGTSNAQAYDNCLKGRSEYYRYTPQHMAKALSFFETAARLDPRYAEAHAYQSYCRTALHVFSWPGSDATLQPALDLAERAIALDDTSAVTHARLGWVLGYLDQPDRCIAAFERAVSLDETRAEVLFAYGETLNRLGQPDRALGVLAKAFSIESFVPPSWEFALGHSHLLKQNYSEALERLLAVLDRVPKFVPARVQLARLYVEVDRMADAQRTADTIRDIAPNYRLSNARRMFPYPQPAEADRLTSALSNLGFAQ